MHLCPFQSSCPPPPPPPPPWGRAPFAGEHDLQQLDFLSACNGTSGFVCPPIDLALQGKQKEHLQAATKALEASLVHVPLTGGASVGPNPQVQQGFGMRLPAAYAILDLKKSSGNLKSRMQLICNLLCRLQLICICCVLHAVSMGSFWNFRPHDKCEHKASGTGCDIICKVYHKS